MPPRNDFTVVAIFVPIPVFSSVPVPSPVPPPPPPPPPPPSPVGRLGSFLPAPSHSVWNPFTILMILLATVPSFSATNPPAMTSSAVLTESLFSSIHLNASVIPSIMPFRLLITSSGLMFTRSLISVLTVSPICFSIACPSGVSRYLFSSLNSDVMVSMPSVSGPAKALSSSFLNVSHSSCIF